MALWLTFTVSLGHQSQWSHHGQQIQPSSRGKLNFDSTVTLGPLCPPAFQYLYESSPDDSTQVTGPDTTSLLYVATSLPVPCTAQFNCCSLYVQISHPDVAKQMLLQADAPNMFCTVFIIPVTP